MSKPEHKSVGIGAKDTNGKIVVQVINLYRGEVRFQPVDHRPLKLSIDEFIKQYPDKA